jgi:hypothetical protein
MVVPAPPSELPGLFELPFEPALLVVPAPATLGLLSPLFPPLALFVCCDEFESAAEAEQPNANASAKNTVARAGVNREAMLNT